MCRRTAVRRRFAAVLQRNGQCVIPVAVVRRLWINNYQYLKGVITSAFPGCCRMPVDHSSMKYWCGNVACMISRFDRFVSNSNDRSFLIARFAEQRCG
ncbi:unnamed protein product [Haemonchus placei]|uniref:DDE_Tnp_1_7 domain-containing protein n=1 Tax=Haemonchus placei TaxID=6290 RepID=A0A0N4X304_HAEPC|nr:unnamed protein product [Haemonchus placei]